MRAPVRRCSAARFSRKSGTLGRRGVAKKFSLRHLKHGSRSFETDCAARPCQSHFCMNFDSGGCLGPFFKNKRSRVRGVVNFYILLYPCLGHESGKIFLIFIFTFFVFSQTIKFSQRLFMPFLVAALTIASIDIFAYTRKATMFDIAIILLYKFQRLAWVDGAWIQSF